jgi:arylsulfatase A-like enzyme
MQPGNGRQRLRHSASALALIGVAALNFASSAVGQEPARTQWKHYPTAPQAPAGAPNVLLIMTDDVGFGASSTFGGPTPTPTFDALAADGLRYNAFHTTAMCSPTRAALLTGRNHHAVASGSIADLSSDQEGYTSVIPKSAATIGRTLHDNGYDTAFFGKNHNTPLWQNGPMGPFDNWPNAWGFDYFYGFNAPFADQYHPDLIENRNPVRPPDQPGYILDRDLSDHLVHWLQVQHTVRPDHPFFAYYASGATHSPHMAPREWIERFKGRFDQGWDNLREETFARQKKMGIIPANAVLTPRPAELPAWDSLTPEMKRVYARMMEVAAAQLAYFDSQIGRVIQQLRDEGELDNTMVIYIQGDNGASLEDRYGSNQELNVIAGIEASDAELARHIDQHGGPEAFGNYPAGWAWATNAPLQWGKRVASHLGGLRDGMVISWPARIKQVGQIRTQFGHVIDIAPTVYEAAHVTPPRTVDGVVQQPIDGTSLVYTFDNANAPARHREQYFELLGNRSYYKDGWMASTLPGNPPWDNSGKVDPNTFKWALYDLNTDWSQSRDVSAQHPNKLAELQADFDQAAKKFHVYPLDANALARMRPGSRPSPLDGRRSFAYYPGDTRYTGAAMPGLGRGWTITAALGVDGGPEQGPILVQGDHFGGLGLLLDQGRPTFIVNPGDMEHVTKLQAPDSLPAGPHEIAVAISAAEGRGDVIELLVDGKSVARTQTASPVRGRGAAYVGRAGIAPLMDGPTATPIPASCGCVINSVKIEQTAAR